ncbi:MAG: DUF58 domain-containing protein [Acidobacteriota bacterium]|jgi:uncharacterized protein (DUF58 family)|nr:DUF58 domain-containing protein [Acidobacteriota bacterium]
MGAGIVAWLRRPVTLGRKPRPGRVRTRPTASGWGFFALISCSFLLSVNFTNNLVFTLTFLLASVAAVGWVHTRMNVRGVRLAAWRCEPVFAGQTAVYRATVENLRRERRFDLHAALCAKPAPEAASREAVHVAGGGAAELRLSRPAPARGLLRAARAEVRSGFPLGVFQARLDAGELPECLVYPAPSGGQPFPDRAADARSHLASEAGEYRDLRRFAPGDPLSRVDWKALARFDELYTKEFDGARGEPALRLRWDDVAAGDAERKLSQLCQWALEAHKQGREYGLELPGAVIAPARGEAHLRECLRALALH